MSEVATKITHTLPRGALLLLSFMLFYSCSKKIDKNLSTSIPTENKTYEFRNISKSVKYVGDEECYDCHSSIYESYKKTEMGRSFYKPTKNNTIEDYTSKNIILDTASGLYYKMTEENGRFYQTQYQIDKDGKISNELKVKAEYVIGSGMHTRSYIANVNGYLTEMPATWYILKKKWDISPGFKLNRQRFTRPILQECMDCHNLKAGLTLNTENRYNQPVPEGIGCESCHGPGELHVKHHNEVMKDSGYIADKKNYIDRTIVNPLHLSDELKMDVCSQCHLQGERTAFKKGKSPDDFIPGMSLNDVKMIFAKVTAKEGDFTIASHTERLSRSNCFLKSGRKLVCITCHDPHISVKDVPTKDFNDKCHTCHNVSQLSKNTASVDHSASSNCVKCHMLKGGVSDIPHVNFTDHWIRKKPVPSDPGVSDPNERSEIDSYYSYRDPAESNYTGFGYILISGGEMKNSDYVYKGIYLLKRAKDKGSIGQEANFYIGLGYNYLARSKEAIEFLMKYTESEPGDVKGHLQLAKAYENAGKLQEALSEYNLAAKDSPFDYSLFDFIGNGYAKLGKQFDAISSYMTSIGLYPIDPTVYNNIANFYSKNGLTDSSIFYYRKAVYYNPLLAISQFNLGNALMSAGNDDEAEDCFNMVIKLDPSNTAAYGNLSILYERRKDFEKALYYANKLLEINPNDPNGQKLQKSLQKKTGKTN